MATRRVAVPALLALFAFYVGYHIFSGDRGLFVWYGLSRDVENLIHENAILQEQLTRVETDVARLKPGTADPDYVDELVRKNLPVAKSDEFVVYVSSLAQNPAN